MAQKPQTAGQRKLGAAARRAQLHFPAGVPAVVFLTDPGRTRDPARIAARLPRGWGIIYRHFGEPDRMHVASALAKIARRRGLRLLISGDPALVMRVGAAGIHWPFARRHEARKWRNRFDLMTVSAHSPGELRTIPAGLFDAALVSTVFPSGSPSARNPLGVLKFRHLARTTQLPLFALGGIAADNAARMAQSAGLAAIDGIVEVFDA